MTMERFLLSIAYNALKYGLYLTAFWYGFAGLELAAGLDPADAAGRAQYANLTALAAGAAAWWWLHLKGQI